MIEIVTYNPNWPAEFDAFRADLLDALGPLARRVDHIGSTAVPGLGAKDIIDVQVTVAALSSEVVDRLCAAGFVYRADITQDHVPPGMTEAPALWAKRYFHQKPGQRRANIHVRQAGNPNQSYPLLFRDYLRAHPNSAAAIDRVKRAIAQHHPDDIEAYYDIKDPVYDLIWDAAQGWAADIEREGPYSAILPNRGMTKTTMTADLILRDVIESDLPILFEQGRDPTAVHMAAFTAKDPNDRAAFDAHWAWILNDPSITVQTIVADGRVAGSITSYVGDVGLEVSYWLGREFWGRGIASAALAQFLQKQTHRPIRGRAAADNLASIRVLEKCGFVHVSHERGYANARGAEIDEVLLELP